MPRRYATPKFLLPALIAGVLALGLPGESTNATPKARVHHHDDGNAYLGVLTQTVDKELARSFKLSVDHGAIINGVEDDSPAEKAGLKEDDVVTSVNGHEIMDQPDLADEIESFKPGDKVKITVNRDGKTLTLEATLDESDGNVELSDTDALRELSGLRGLNGLRGLSALHGLSGLHGGTAPRAFAWSGDELREFPDQGYIGLSYVDLTSQLATQMGVTGSGALVTEVQKRTPAEKAGLKAGDVITRVDDESVSRRNSLSELIGDYHAGDTAKLTVIREKKEMSISVVVDDRNDSDEFGVTAPRSGSRSYSRSMDMARRELDAARRMADRSRGMRYGDDRNVPNTDDLEARIKELEAQLDKLQTELKEIRH